ncbi:MAG: hypothetical protein VX664_05120 [Chloroflexota bacterium]|uniref:Uncharacterized protein n=1 Tax=marine metagenome TaxID=408172 RepID=A0A381S045_9ZZZZ|nr:hypothetical protein [Chloroflexota bacterium]
METTRDRLKHFRQTLTLGKWRGVRMYVHNDVEFEHFSLIATNISSGQLHYYKLGTRGFTPASGSG